MNVEKREKPEQLSTGDKEALSFSGACVSHASFFLVLERGPEEEWACIVVFSFFPHMVTGTRKTYIPMSKAVW